MEGFDLIFVNIPIEPVTILPIIVTGCAGEVGIAVCPDDGLVQFGSGDGFIIPKTAPFDVGSATISVGLSAAVGDAFGTKDGSFIDEGELPPTAVGGFPAPPKKEAAGYGRIASGG